MVDTKQASGQKGYTGQDYKDAAEKTGSVRGIARELGVSRTTAKEMCQIHDIEVESVGGVPGKDD